ncbi:ATP-binding protein [Catalinimonas sp. 4WD22]|uniref:sensor histidine kinase n=1 Tax=Catalinimonas locisalis TaxID=3133978 RepID=UPI00310151E1
MKIRTQIFSGFLLVLFLTLILAVVTIYYLGNLGTASTKILEDNYRSVKSSEQIIISLSKMDQILAKVCLGQNYNDSSLISILDKEKQILSNNLAICRQNASNQKEVMLVSQMEDEYASYIHHINEFKTTIDRDGLYFTVLQRLNEVIRQNCVELVTLNHKDLSAKDEYAQALYFRSKIYVFLIMVLVLMIVGWTVYKVPHEIVKPLTKITEKIKRISQGEYQQEIKVDSSSELGDLAQAFNDMSLRLQEFEKLNIEEVQAQKSRMESIIRSMNDGLIILDEQEEIILVNETTASLIDIEESELIGKKLWELAEENEVLHELEASLSKKDYKPASIQETHSFIKIHREDGKNAFFTKEIFKVYSKDSSARKFLGHIITLKDITSFKESDEAKSNFIAVVSHELKTPLSALNMSLMLLSNTRFGSLNEEQSKTVNSMKREVQRLVNMVTELLDLSKVENGRISLEKELIKPSILMEYAIAPVEVKFKQKDVLIVKKIDENLPDIFIDPEKISWVLINLMTNALRYSSEGGKIILEARKVNKMVEFSVKDFGPGISKDNLKRVFNKFVQLNTNGKKNKHGLGLGLAISKEVVDAHEGQIYVESELGAWSRFYFQVPIEAVQDDKGQLFKQPLQQKTIHIS